jgi:hypothetical protein
MKHVQSPSDLGIPDAPTFRKIFGVIGSDNDAHVGIQGADSNRAGTSGRSKLDSETT